MARNYGLTVETPDEIVKAFLQSATNARLTLPLNGVGTLDATFDAASADGQALYSILASTIPVARLSRNGATVFTGPLSGLDMTAGDSGEISASFTDWTGALGHWAPYGTYKAASADTIVDGLLALSRWPGGVGSFPGSPLLTRSGSVSATASVSRAEQSSVLEEIQQAAATAPFDWYVDHANASLKIASSHGSDKSLLVQFGVGEVPGSPTKTNSQAARVTYQPPRNVVWATSGKGKVYGSTGTSSVNAYGQYFEQTDAGNANAQAFANAYRRDNPRQVVEITADPQLAPAWLTDYYLGDTVSVNIATRALNLSAALRVNQIEVAFDDQLVEVSNNLTFEVI